MMPRDNDEGIECSRE